MKSATVKQILNDFILEVTSVSESYMCNPRIDLNIQMKRCLYRFLFSDESDLRLPSDKRENFTKSIHVYYQFKNNKNAVGFTYRIS